ncbi:hypothetical protein CLAFUW4_09470 [Fulvia fulva]|uniref:Uncharacterized protein n=1 Tax=Passalora fulva TaxID=5499 RepID=A0A9Q8PFF9_PASFU|nr:uncharacterized protein CLAFUR5_09567 [Fulvia fulva]KAK4613918.1 hypothetical protein CLAFUR4_09476 [Fulvia fulva]KAK4614742.1 hypothetical protein CLAFUR0_09467 [Fulvia fulva]UJO21437.1 hypothetical protein CLAFUR5_09567 [Fulvia fulva]WPV20135.1 hypothetical protein CLAFUW4_09470 [Fulvia fulva]WPV35129.1 hypothetical protein CLAFUW7_09471 [Fulvia fulva]
MTNTSAVTDMATATTPQRLSLEQRIQALPQELQDVILDFTVAVKSPNVITLTETHGKKYKPPLCLQVNRKIRRESEQPYYLRAAVTSTNPELIQRFVASLEPHNRPRLHRLQVIVGGSSIDAQWEARDLRHNFRRNGMEQDMSQTLIMANYFVPKPGMWQWKERWVSA